MFEVASRSLSVSKRQESEKQQYQQRSRGPHDQLIDFSKEREVDKSGGKNTPFSYDVRAHKQTASPFVISISKKEVKHTRADYGRPESVAFLGATQRISNVALVRSRNTSTCTRVPQSAKEQRRTSQAGHTIQSARVHMYSFLLQAPHNTMHFSHFIRVLSSMSVRVIARSQVMSLPHKSPHVRIKLFDFIISERFPFW